MGNMTIAMADIVQNDVHFLQLRNHDLSKAAANLIGFFGGRVEEGESAIEAVSREIREETTLLVEPRDFVLTGAFEASIEHKGEVIHLDGECFSLEVPSGVLVEAKEGEIVKIPRTELVSRLNEMSPATAEVISKYYGEEN